MNRPGLCKSFRRRVIDVLNKVTATRSLCRMNRSHAKIAEGKKLGLVEKIAWSQDDRLEEGRNGTTASCDPSNDKISDAVLFKSGRGARRNTKHKDCEVEYTDERLGLFIAGNELIDEPPARP